MTRTSRVPARRQRRLVLAGSAILAWALVVAALALPNGAPEAGASTTPPRGAASEAATTPALPRAAQTPSAAPAPGAAGGALSAAAVSPWAIATSPNVAGVDNHLQEVSCVSRTRCLSVGYTVPGSGSVRSIAQTLGSGTWRFATLPQRGTSYNAMWNLSCVTPLFCVAVGDYFDVATQRYQTLIATYSSGRWQLTPSPNRNSSDNFLFGVDCTDANDCVAVGRSVALRTGAIKSLVLSLVDDTWVITPTPNRAGVDNYLADVSCSDANHCVAVGYTAPPTGSSASYQTLVLSTDGTDWTIASTPNVASAHNLLRDVSCPSRTTCVAVGGASATAGETALIETLAAGTWSITTSPNRPGNDNQLWGVSCPTETACVAGGYARDHTTGRGRNLLETFDGMSWTLTTAPSRTNTANTLYGMSCVDIDHCVAVGDFVNNSLALYRTSILTNS